MTERLSEDLLDLLGEASFVALAEAFGGTRLYIPQRLGADHAISEAIGSEKAEALARRYAPAVLRIPLARKIRARHYRAVIGLSNARIASRLGMTETGVEGLFNRMDDAPVKGSERPDNQLQFQL